MGVRTHLNLAQGELITARRRAEEKKYSREFLYNMEVVIRAVSMMKDKAKEENHFYHEKIKSEKYQVNRRTKSKKKIKKAKTKTKERNHKTAA